MSGDRVRSRGLGAVLVGVYALAFAVRLEWLLNTQHPLDAVYSDMGGYVERAEWLLAHKTPADPRILALYPWGTHALVALEFLALGRQARLPIAVFHAMLGAVPAAAMTSLSFRLVPRLLVAALVGVTVAFWYPQVAYTGFFLSEIWFSALIAAHAALTARDGRRPYAPVATGVLAAVAVVVRPQFVLTWAIDSAGLALARLRRGGLPAAAVAVACVGLPLAIAGGASAVRLHRLSGHWGLISENDQMTRLWAETDVCKLESTWRTPTGETWTYWFAPPSGRACPPENDVHFRGYIGDPDLLRSIRLARTRGLPLRRRLARMVRNVRNLVLDNLPWPESNYHDHVHFVGFPGTVPRPAIAMAFRDALLAVVLPLCAAGLALGRRNRALLIAAANLGTMLFAAVFFFGEARYRIPYEPFAIVLAGTGAYELGRRAVGLLRRHIAPKTHTQPSTASGMIATSNGTR